MPLCLYMITVHVLSQPFNVPCFGKAMLTLHLSMQKTCILACWT